MNKIRIVLSIVALMFLGMHMNAQSFQLKDLVGKTWTGVSGYYGCDIMDLSISFTEKGATYKGTDKKGKVIAIFFYNMYLTNEIPKKYDASLLGLNSATLL